MFFYPAARAFVEKIGARWEDSAEETGLQSNGCDFELFPDRLRELDDQVTKQVFHCTDSGRSFRISQKELSAYRRHGLPFPRLHWRERMDARTRLANHPKLHEGVSAKSGTVLHSSFPPGSGWTVWTREEYEKEFN